MTMLINKQVVSAVLLMAVMVMVAPIPAIRQAEAVLSCGQITSMLTPCSGYLKNGGAVPRPCCNAVRSLVRAASTPLDRQKACRCLKSAYSGFPGIKLPNAESLPGKCHVIIHYKISLSTDCTKVR